MPKTGCKEMISAMTPATAYRPSRVLDGSRVPQAVLRAVMRNTVFPPDFLPDIEELTIMLSDIMDTVGPEEALASLGLPFTISGPVDARELAECILARQPSPPPPAIVLASAGSRGRIEQWDALDTLWCPPGDCWLGMASADSRDRAEPSSVLSSAGGYAERSLLASLMHDLDQSCAPCMDAPCWGQAILLEPAEMACAVPGWLHSRWGVIVLDEWGARARSETFAGEAALRDTLAGRAVWPPRNGLPVWVPSPVEEEVFVRRLIETARRKPVRPGVFWGDPDDHIEW